MLALKVLVSGVLLYLIVLKIDWSQFASTVKKGNILYLSYGMLFGVIFNMIKFLRWHNLIKTENSVYTFWDASKSYMLGNSLGLVTPLRAGDLGRALYFIKDERPKIMGLTIIDRIMDITAVLTLSIGGSFYLINRGFGILVVLLAILSICVLYSHKLLWIFLKKIIGDGPIWQKVGKLIDMLKNLDPKTVSTALILSFLAFISVLFQFYYLVSAFEGTTLLAVCLVTPLITLSSIIPVSFMGLGVREGISIVLFSAFGITGATALSVAFLGFAMNNVFISIIGIVFLSESFLVKKNELTRLRSLSGQKNLEQVD